MNIKRVGPLALAAAIALTGTTSVSAAAVDAGGPQAVVEASVECSTRQDWLCMARLMDPVALKDVRSLFAEIFQGDTLDPRIQAMFGGKTGEQIARLSDTEFLAAFLGGVMRQAGGITIEKVQVLGGVAEGQDQYHAVTRSVARLELADTALTTVDVISVRKVDGQWRLQLNGDVQAVMAGLRRLRAQREQAAPPGGSADGSVFRVPQLEKFRRAREAAAKNRAQAEAALEQAAAKGAQKTERAKAGN
ncbi:MAG: hypothetical protein JF591_04880 [Lysobacter sp.]|nr:hypothetical protein [Lysobacter sp.]